MDTPLEHGAARGNGGRQGILLADGEAHSCFVLALILRRAGYDVVTVGSSLEAIVDTLADHDHERRFDLLVVDPQATGPTSDELQRALDRLQMALPVLYLDGYCGRDAGHGRGPRDGALQPVCLEKPFEPDELLHRIEQIVGAHSIAADQPARPGDGTTGERS
jgi:DNA-binding response OmpR family regulator